MTYPPQPGQPPYGQQPDPYGQGGQPPSGGFPQQGPPQQGQPYPGQQPYPQQGGGYYDQTGAYQQQQYPGYDQTAAYGQQNPYGQPYGQGFGGPPAPPPKSKTGLLIGIAIAAVVLVAVGVTGFIAPGFFLTKDNTAGTGGAEAVAQQIVDGLNAKDANALTALKCADAEPDISEVINAVSSVSNVKLGKVEKVSDSEYTATVTLNVNGTPGSTTGTIASAGNKWCWSKVSGLRTSSPTSTKKPTTPRSSTAPRSSTGAPSSGDAAAGVQNFVDKINAKDKPGATALVCPGAEANTVPYIDQAVASDSPAITATPSGSGSYISADIGGTYEGKEAGGILLGRLSGSTFCVAGFVVY
ncbi:MAG: hypothetical protein QOI21_5728 [Actinomycetota bacterium]|jgi:hypothetical protein|nr:hypothetical protein [Actinomycetota bacterium]